MEYFLDVLISLSMLVPLSLAPLRDKKKHRQWEEAASGNKESLDNLLFLLGFFFFFLPSFGDAG